MKKELIDYMVRSGQLRIRQQDKEKIKSILKSAEINSAVVKNIPLDENSATVIFREIYESIRQLGDAQWWVSGYEPLNHETSLEILKEMKIRESIRLNHLVRFKKIRNDANYRGFRVSVSQAKELLEFWDACCNDIIRAISKNLR